MGELGAIQACSVPCMPYICRMARFDAVDNLKICRKINGVPKGIRTPVTAVRGRNLHLTKSKFYDKLFNNQLI